MSQPAKLSGAVFAARIKALEARDPGFAAFFAKAIAATSAEDLERLRPAVVEKTLRRAYEQLDARGDNPFLVEITPLRGDGRALQVIDVYSPDMPFIVDSVLGAIRARGATIHALSHPIIDKADKGAESFLQALIEPIGEAATAELKAEIEEVLTETGRAVRDWRPMLERLRRETAKLSRNSAELPTVVLDETTHFLTWLADHNFTFLGMREYRVEGKGVAAKLVPVPDTGLGVLRDPAFKFLRAGTEYVEMTPQHMAFLRAPAPLMVTKANVRARVHRRSHMDYIGIKIYDATGKATGELRVIGLFTSHALARPHSEVPLIRRKLAQVMRRAKLDPKGHAGKALLSALESYPRDELFQIEEDQLAEFAAIIADLPDRPRVRVLSRIDRFDNFVSVLVFMPRDRYDSEVRARVGAYLAKRYDGRVSAFYPQFPEGDLVRIHFIIGRNGGITPKPHRESLEADITDLTRNFGDLLLAAAPRPQAVADYRDAFPAGYQASHTPEQALADISVFAALGEETDIAIRFGANDGSDGTLGLKFYHPGAPIPLSDRVPMLENFGFKVIDERTHTIVPRDGAERYVHDMVLAPTAGGSLADAVIPMLEAALLAVWQGAAESDGLNQLTTTAGLAWPDVALLRALSRYLQQVGLAYSQPYIATVLADQAEASAALVALFHALFDPAFAGDRDSAAEEARAAIGEALDRTGSLDEERIVKRVFNLVEAVVRTNAYQRDAEGLARPALALKFDCAKIDKLPTPHPYREIFVYSPRVEGVHLRFGAIARGGLRWSDRPEDFRTEVLGLVKAQQVKNAIIVPVGAKGGFVPKRTPKGAAREVVQAEGTACYKIFVASLLDVTDNLAGDGAVLPPAEVIRRDDDDPYLVVAADKGTAHFSDTANAIAEGRDYWLGDAFASGGSAGYDHKEMAITARGGWESVKRHFRELDRDIQATPFSVVGVGDMSGDVFGNGMLQSRQIRLVAAFDHRDIFIDPNPDPATSFAERQRLFALPRSSWQDYDTALLSPGGGIYSRAAKSIPLSPQAQAALGFASSGATPQEVMSAILRAPVDLLWFGGIGTYVRASTETDAQAGDRANDAIRITGSELRATVVGEGANLGMTQRGRVEYALKGGRLNTDAIDNSAGVNSSDLEVNIKIALGPLVRSGKMPVAARNALLVEMTEEVAALCLRNNYLQPLALSLAERQGVADFPDHRDLITALEARGILDRGVEYLPDEAALNERAVAGVPLTRPELAVLLAYAKNTLNADLLASGALDEPYLARELFRYFPERLHAGYPEAITGHRLRREVIATVLANAMINRGGPAYVNEMMAMTSADAGHVAMAYATVRDAFGLTELNAAIDALDGRIGGATQLGLYAEVRALLLRESLWFLRNASFDHGLQTLVERYAAGVAQLRALLPSLLPEIIAAAIDRRAAVLQQEGVPAELARRIAELPALTFATGITLVTERTGASLEEAARAFFGVQNLFDLAPVIAQGRAIVLGDRFDRMALDRALANLMRAQRDLSADILAAGKGPVAERLASWQAARAAAVARVSRAISELTQGEVTVSRLSVVAGLLADLARGT